MSAPGARLRLFDCAQPTPGPLPAALGTEIGKPVALDRIADQLADDGWYEPRGAHCRHRRAVGGPAFARVSLRFGCGERAVNAT